MDEQQRQARLVQLIAESQRRLYAYIMTLLVNRSDVEDVLQETNVVLWEKSGEFKFPEGDAAEALEQFTAWASRIAYFQSLARMKVRQRDRLQFDDALLGQLRDAAAEKAAEFDDRRSALLDCIEKLSAQDRALVERRYSDDAQPQRMAEELGRTRHAINQALYRIRGALSHCVQRTLRQGGAQ